MEPRYILLCFLGNIIKDIGLDKILYSKQKRRDLVETMIISRALYPKK